MLVCACVALGVYTVRLRKPRALLVSQDVSFDIRDEKLIQVHVFSLQSADTSEDFVVECCIDGQAWTTVATLKRGNVAATEIITTQVPNKADGAMITLSCKGQVLYQFQSGSAPVGVRKEIKHITIEQAQSTKMFLKVNLRAAAEKHEIAFRIRPSAAGTN